MPDANDMDLVREYATANSEPAFETLVRRHISLVHSVALRQAGNPVQAEEITQAVFLILARKAARLRPDTVLAGWLHETARFASASFLRGESRRHRREQEAYVQSKLQETTADRAWEQLAPLLDEAIGQLGKADRNAVVLRFFQNKSAREIAVALNVHESAAQKRLNRAVEKLRAWFLKRGVAVSTDALSGALLIHSVPGAPAHLAASVVAASAKGSAISSSTLTLIKGALKIMAWTKTKTAIVAGITILLATGTTTVIVETRSGPDISGTWQGTLELPGAGIQRGESPKTRLVFAIVKQNGNYQASGVNIDQGKNSTLDKFSYRHGSIHAEVTERRRHGDFRRLQRRQILGAAQFRPHGQSAGISRTTFRRRFCAARRFGFAGLLERRHSDGHGTTGRGRKNIRAVNRHVPRRFPLSARGRQPSAGIG